MHTRKKLQVTTTQAFYQSVNDIPHSQMLYRQNKLDRFDL
jgi:hypothetical protein